MTQKTIAITPQVYELLMNLQARLKSGFAGIQNPTASRMVDYLVNLSEVVEASMASARFSFGLEGNETPTEDVMAQAGMKLAKAIHEAMLYDPPKHYYAKRGAYAAATPEERLFVFQEIQTHLGIMNPPKELVAYYLEHSIESAPLYQARKKARAEGKPEPTFDSPISIYSDPAP